VPTDPQEILTIGTNGPEYRVTERGTHHGNIMASGRTMSMPAATRSIYLNVGEVERR
jgi:hypothetical protein